MYDILIIGGGLSGLINARLLALSGLSVVVIEKNTYPFHRVCGEYISNEVKPFLESIGCFPHTLAPTSISTLMVTSPSGFSLQAKLDLGAFGISRYAFDDFLKTKAIEAGATIVQGEQIYEVQKTNDGFICKSLTQKTYTSRLVIGAQGKRSMIDKYLNRSFVQQRSPYIGVKYHIRTHHPDDLIALHNFQDGYCGISKIENDTYCLCYLTTRENLRKHGTIAKMEEAILYKNPFLKQLFTSSEFLFHTPEVINEISFSPKSLSDQEVIFCGDSAGMIAPLCGNGMAMAIHAAKLLSESIIRHKETLDETAIYKHYKKEWTTHFKNRLRIGRTIQKLFGRNTTTEISLRLLSRFPFLLRWIISKTHGKILEVKKSNEF
ncbi:MAG: fumarate reductase/succinate dehydrogenase flavoprotein domain protein [Chitinophagaceae bacterium]|nr:fumarate reductase/succinate dehydrogenase flavoprotein domain protein [Chitinophagaceae bacterium]